MLTLRIKQARCALTDGRLDEAYELLQAHDLARHRQGQELIGRLARALAQRGRDHLAGDRPAEALADCNKAQKLAGNLPVIAQLRSAIGNTSNGKRQQQQARAIKIAQAREHIDKGWLSAGEQILLDAAGDDTAAEVLLQEAAAKRVEIDTAVRKIQEALQRSDPEAAFKVILETGLLRDNNKKLSDLLLQIKTQAVELVRQAISHGRMDQVQTMLRTLQPLLDETPELRQLSQVFYKIRRACKYIDSGQARSAVNILRQLKTVLPDAGWLAAAIEQAEKAALHLEQLGTGPLGWVMSCDSGNTAHDELARGEHRVSPGDGPVGGVINSPDTVGEKRPDENGLSGFTPGAGSPLPDRFVIRIDGAGSFLVLRNSRITVGPISAPEQPDIGLVAEPLSPMVTIERMDEDYFIRVGKPTNVNDTPVAEKLLAHNDNIALSARCRLKFLLPNSASTTACLDLSTARHPCLDIRRAVLLDREIIIGPGSSAHIRVERCPDTVVLCLQDGQLLCRTKETVIVNGRAQDRRIGLPMERPIKIGDLSMVLSRI